MNRRTRRALYGPAGNRRIQATTDALMGLMKIYQNNGTSKEDEMAKGTREVIDLYEGLLRQGFRVEETAGGHYQAKPPGEGMPIHFTKRADPTALKNVIARLRRVGFIWPPPAKTTNGKSPLEVAARAAEQDAFELRDALEEDVMMAPGTTPSVDYSEEGIVEEAPTPRDDDSMDRLWKELRDAKQLVALAEEVNSDAALKLELSQNAHARTLKELETAKTELRAKKAAFDAAFGDE